MNSQRYGIQRRVSHIDELMWMKAWRVRFWELQKKDLFIFNFEFTCWWHLISVKVYLVALVMKEVE
jgi:hypothetical protein